MMYNHSHIHVNNICNKQYFNVHTKHKKFFLTVTMYNLFYTDIEIVVTRTSMLLQLYVIYLEYRLFTDGCNNS